MDAGVFGPARVVPWRAPVTGPLLRLGPERHELGSMGRVGPDRTGRGGPVPIAAGWDTMAGQASTPSGGRVTGSTQPDLAALVRGARQRSGLSQEALANRSGVAVRTISDLERGRIRRPHAATVEHLARALGLSEEQRRELADAVTATIAAAGAPGGSDAAEVAPAAVNLLPPEVGMIGREGVVDDLRRRLVGPGSGGGGIGAAPVVLLTGRAGLGKTTTAVHTAHRLREEFPDGQLFARLTRAGVPLDPTHVLSEWLVILGSPRRAIPDEVEDRSAMLRARMSGRRMLVVLDDAVHEWQIRPLLPTSAGCACLITSRMRLVALDRAATVALPPMRPDEALRQLAYASGRDGLEDDPAAAQIVELCERLPLAVRIAAAKLARSPRLTSGRLAERLADERDRLTELSLHDLDMRATLDVGYAMLGEEQRHALRLLAIPDVDELTAHHATALIGNGDLLDDLYAAHLIEATGSRYRLHDLVRLYAREAGDRDDEPDARLEAFERFAHAWLDGLAPLPTPLSDAWFDRHRADIAATISQAARLRSAYAWRLAARVRPWYERSGDHENWQTTHELALDAAKATGDRIGSVRMLLGLGDLATDRGERAAAITYFNRAAALTDREGESDLWAEATAGLALAYSEQHLLAEAEAHATQVVRHGTHARSVARAYLTIGKIRNRQRRYADARQLLAAALELSEQVGPDAMDLQAAATDFLGTSYALDGDHATAEPYLNRSIDLWRRLGYALREAEARASLGGLMGMQGRPEASREMLRAAMSISEPFGDTSVRAMILQRLADLATGEGDTPGARHLYGEAVAILAKIKDLPRLAMARESLDRLPTKRDPRAAETP